MWKILPLVALLPMLYGWAYRGLGPPLPSYLQRRLQERAAGSRRRGSAAVHDYRAWGRAGDVVWLFVGVTLAGGLAVSVCR